MKPTAKPPAKGGISSLNSKPATPPNPESINESLKDHSLQANWEHQKTIRVLHEWAEIFSQEFQLGMQVPAICIDKLAPHLFGTYHNNRNAFGLYHEIALNVRHLHRPLAATLCTLFHEQLHGWQFLFGKR